MRLSAPPPFLIRIERALCLLVLAALAHGAEAQTTANPSAPYAVRTEAEALTAADAGRGDILGYAVSLSGDRALVGATAADPAGDASGAAYVFHRTGDAWAEEAKLVPDDAAPGDYFGVAVALDGDRALVGGYHHDDQRGAAYVFSQTAEGWTQDAKLPAVGDAGDNLGVAVALRGNLAVVGADRRDGVRGAAYVFERTATGWALAASLTAPDGSAGDHFGAAVALSPEGRVVIGARGTDEGRGAAYVFDRGDTGWTLRATLTAPDGEAGDNLGVSVALDGDHVLTGAPFDDDQGEDSGAAYAFTLGTDGAPLAAKLTDPTGETDDYFGWSVALGGSRALVGSRYDDDDLNDVRNVGSAFLYERDGSEWTVEAKLLRTATPNAGAGVSVSLSDHHALVGAPYHDGSRGTAHVFELSPSAVATAAEPTADADLALSVAPNPAASRARVSFGLAEPGAVRASVFDLLGREVAVLADAPYAAGRHDLDLDAAALPAGLYLVRVATAGRSQTMRITVAR